MPPRYTQAADDDLQAIYVASVAMFGVAQAERYVAMLRQICAFIGDHPRLARERVEIAAPVRARSVKSHVIVYEIDEGDVAVILRFRHVREDWVSDPVNG